MAEYLIQGETLTELGDKIRVLSGTEDTLTTSQMTSNVQSANDEVDAQSALIDQLSAALEGKARGGNAEPVLQDKTVTPTTSQQTVTADDDYDGLNSVTVNAIPSTYVKPTATKAATTYTPTTSDQTITSGTYLTGTQTISGDSNLVAGNIKSGVSIFGISGSYEGSGGSVQYEIITIPAGATSATYTLPRVTAAYGKANLYSVDITGRIKSNETKQLDSGSVLSIKDTLVTFIALFECKNFFSITNKNVINNTDVILEFDTLLIRYSGGSITWESCNVNYPITLLLINDPNADAIST